MANMAKVEFDEDTLEFMDAVNTYNTRVMVKGFINEIK